MSERQGAVFLEFTYPISELVNINRHEHRQVQAKKRKKLRAITAEFASRMPPVNTPARITVEFGWPDKRTRDADNFEIKALIDALVDAHVIEADDGRHVPETMRRDLGKTHNKGGHVALKIIVDPLAITANTWENRNAPRGAGNTIGGLTHISELAERG